MLAHCIATAPLHKLVRQIYKAEGTLPKELLNGPKLFPGNWLFLQGFFNLHYERPSGDVVMPIPWSSIQSYAADFLGLRDEQLHRFHTILRGVDEKYVENANASLKQEMRKTKPPPRKR